MKKRLTEWFSVFTLIFASTLAFEACSNSYDPATLLALFGIQVEIAPTFTAADMKAAVNGICEGNCDGDIADPETHTIEATSTTIGGYLAAEIDGTSYQITTADSVNDNAEMQLMNCLNSGAAGDMSCTEMNGSSIIAATHDGNLVITGVNPFYDYTFNVTDTEVTNTSIEVITVDLVSFSTLLSSPMEPGAQAIVDAAVTAGGIDAADNTNREVRVTGTQTVACDTGDILMRKTVDTEIDGTEMIVGDPLGILITTIFRNCLLASDSILEDGGPTESIVLNGTLRTLTVNDDDGMGTVTTDGSMWGTLFLTTDLGDGNPFWANSVDVKTDIHFTTPASTTTYNGGFCFDGSVELGADDEMADDDDCSSSGQLFMPFEEYLNRIP